MTENRYVHDHVYKSSLIRPPTDMPNGFYAYLVRFLSVRLLGRHNLQTVSIFLEFDECVVYRSFAG